MPVPSYYERLIGEDAPSYDAEQVECYMRLKLYTLDQLTRDAFRAEVKQACLCVDADPALAARLVETYRLTSLMSS